MLQKAFLFNHCLNLNFLIDSKIYSISSSETFYGLSYGINGIEEMSELNSFNAKKPMTTLNILIWSNL